MPALLRRPAPPRGGGGVGRASRGSARGRVGRSTVTRVEAAREEAPRGQAEGAQADRGSETPSGGRGHDHLTLADLSWGGGRGGPPDARPALDARSGRRGRARGTRPRSPGGEGARRRRHRPAPRLPRRGRRARQLKRTRARSPRGERARGGPVRPVGAGHHPGARSGSRASWRRWASRRHRGLSTPTWRGAARAAPGPARRGAGHGSPGCPQGRAGARAAAPRASLPCYRINDSGREEPPAQGGAGRTARRARPGAGRHHRPVARLLPHTRSTSPN